MQAVDQERAELEAALSQLDAATGVSAGAADSGTSTVLGSKATADFETPIYE
jgi:hypothetical protein